MTSAADLNTDPAYYMGGGKGAVDVTGMARIVLYWEPYFDDEQTLQKAFTVDVFANGYGIHATRSRHDTLAGALAKIHYLERQLVIDEMARALCGNP